MWQRFTERARKVVFYAQEEAQKAGQPNVSTEHLLLGLLREEDNVASRVLSKLGINPETICSEVRRQLPLGPAKPSQDMTLTPRARRVIDFAYFEAKELQNNYIGSEHLLLGIIREGDGLGGRVLAAAKLDLNAARSTVIRFQDAEAVGKGKPDEATQWRIWVEHLPAETKKILLLAYEESSAAGVHLGPEHLLLGILRDTDSGAAKALQELGIDIEKVKASLARQSAGS